MSTRAIYRFYDENNHFAVYKHYDGHPVDSAMYFFKALQYAWSLPRYEADEMAAAFVAANKGMGGGDIRLLNMSQSSDRFSMGQEYEYEVFPAKNGQLILRVWDDEYQDGEVLYYGRLKDFCLEKMGGHWHVEIVDAFHGEMEKVSSPDEVKAQVEEIVNDATAYLNKAIEKLNAL